VSASGPAPAGESRLRRLFAPSLRARLLMLVVASVVPLVCMGVVREYWTYQTLREQAYEGLQTIAHGLAVALERDLQLRVSALETLATSPALQSDDLGLLAGSFDSDYFRCRRMPGRG
jgi:hypothetical protein